MEAIHVFIKGRNGNGVFYRTEDFLVLISIVGTIAREMGISIIAFCPMFNHVHILVKGIDMETLRAFIHKIETTFVREYNHEYNRAGPLFQKSFGRSVKKESKTILGCVAYVFNNPVAGKLCKEALEFRWNLLAFRDYQNPFSLRIARDRCRKAMRYSLDRVKYYVNNALHLNYRALRMIFNDLNTEEHQQVIDHILAAYGFLDYRTLESLYGSYERLLTAIDSNAGSEYDIEDEYGDHSHYRKMLKVVMKLGYTGSKLNFEPLPQNRIDSLFFLLRKETNAPAQCINKFLHRTCAGSQYANNQQDK